MAFSAIGSGSTISAPGDYTIASPGQGEQPSALHIQIVNSGATFSLTVLGQSVQLTGTSNYIAVPYKNAAGAAVAGGTAITAAAIILVPCYGQNIDLAVSAITGGTLTVSVTPIYGLTAI